MDLQAWPFLISSHKVKGFTVVVAPDFMCRDQSARRLASYAGGEPGEGIKSAEMKDTKGETLTLTYRVVLAEGSLTGENVPVLKDVGGREIPIIEGVVTKGGSKKINLTERDFSAIRESYREPFITLWRSPGILPIQPIDQPLNVDFFP